MTTTLDFAVIAVPITFAAVALLVLGRRHIHGQMEQIAKEAQARAAARSRREVGACEAEIPLEVPLMTDTARQPA